MLYRRLTVPVPDDLCIPTCDGCNDQLIDGEMAELLDAVLEPIYQEELKKHPKEDFRIIVDVDRGRLELLGDLDGRPQVIEAMKTLAQVAPGSWTVQARNVRLRAGGAEQWIAAVNTYLQGSRLRYSPCQLSYILDGEETYLHPDSTFVDSPTS